MSLNLVPRGLRLLGAVAVVGLFSLVVTASPASAAGAKYATWTVAGANPSWSGTVNVPAAGFPAVSFTTDSNTPQVRPGTGVYLGPSTPFGAVFGSSQNQQYLGLGTAAGLQPSTTTFTFAEATPANGWGFNLGDIDADHVHIEAVGPGGPLTADDLGFQSGFNFCDTSPRPSGCTRPPFTDVPTWNAATSTLTGNVNDTDGSSGWFRPTKPITSMSFRFDVQSGSPAYQIWFAALTSNVGGKVTENTPTGPTPPPVGTQLVLRPTVPGPPSIPVPTDPEGNFQVPDVHASQYNLVVEVPPCYVAPPPTPVDLSTGDALGIALAIEPGCKPAPPPAPAPAPAPIQGVKPPRPPHRTIPATGGITDVLTPVGVGLLAVGFGCLRVAQRRRRALSS